MAWNRKPGPKRAARKPVQRQHLKYVGISEKTRAKYRMAVARFFVHLELFNILIPNSFDKLDYQVSEFINMLWQEGDSYGEAQHVVSALARFVPGCRKALATSRQYLTNWGRTITRHRALPLPQKVVVAMAGAALAFERADLYALLLVGFLGFLRTNELLTLTPQDITFLAGNSRAILSIRESKSGQRSGTVEHVSIADPLVCSALAFACRSRGPEQSIYTRAARSFYGEFRWLARFFGLEARNLTPYGLRRGGATWYFLQTGSIDKATVRGRWRDSRTARIYIETGVVALREWEFSQDQLQLMHRASQAAMRGAVLHGTA